MNVDVNFFPEEVGLWDVNLGIFLLKLVLAALSLVNIEFLKLFFDILCVYNVL